MEYLSDIQQAIRKVRKPYFVWCDCRTKKEEEMLERVFCYEFYHQFRNIMHKKGNIQKYKDLYFQGEINKHNFIPDFVLHSGQNNFNKQAVVIEVKTAVRIKQNQKNCNMKEDLHKILNLIYDGNLNYEYGIFIGVNCSANDLKKKIRLMRGTLFENYSELLSRVYILGTKDNSSFTLGSVVYE